MSGNCSSSLDLAWHFHRMGLFPVWSSILALSQWAGRGQFGRTWQSPPGNIYASWHLPNPPKPWAGMLSLVVGYMIIQGLMSAGIEVQLKWPNDLVIKGKKVGGILIEARGDAFIAGVGVNLVSSPEKFQIDDPHALAPTSLKAEVGFSESPLALWTRLVQTGQSCYHETISSGPDDRELYFTCFSLTWPLWVKRLPLMTITGAGPGAGTGARLELTFTGHGLWG